MRIKEYVPGSGQSQKVRELPACQTQRPQKCIKVLGFLAQKPFDSVIEDDGKLIKLLAENYIPDHPLRPTFKEDVPSDPRKFLDDKDTLLGEFEKLLSQQQF